MKILIACIHYPVASGRFLQRALLRMGHEVRTAGPTTGNHIWGTEVYDRYVWTPDYLTEFEPFPRIDCLFQWPYPVDDWIPDLIVTADSAFTLLGPAPCPHVCVGQDNHVRDYRLRKFDALFLCHTWGARMGEPDVYWLPPCYDPEMCFDMGLERDIDVAMVAYPYPERVTLVEGMKATGLKVAAGLGPVYDEYRALYNRAKIAFVKSSNGDVTNRMFEGMAMGCCVLADPAPDAPKLGLIDGVHYWPYRDTAGAVEAAKMLLQGHWQTIAENGKQIVGAHTWDARAKQMLETLGMN